MDREWLTVEDIRTELRVCAMTVYRRINAGEIEAVKVGRSFRISRQALDTYLEGARTRGDSRQ